MAIAAAGNRIDKLEVIWLPDKRLRTDGLALESTKGETPLKGFAERHVDVCRLDYNRLGKVATVVVEAIDNSRYRIFTKAKVRELLSRAVEQGRIDLDGLKAKVREEVSS